MSQKKRKQQTSEAPAEPILDDPGPEMLRRVLLGMVTALIVARPLVLGEDPGMLQPGTDANHLILTFGWLLVALGWGVWRYWGRVGDWHGGPVEISLLATVLAVVCSTAVAPYRHPAILIAWEWIALFAALFVLRQLVRTESDRRHILAALLASVVSLAVYAPYQYLVELPAQRKELPSSAPPTVRLDVEQVVALVGTTPVGPLPPTILVYTVAGRQAEKAVLARDRTARLWGGSSETDRASATYAHPDSFATLLVLFLPALLAIVVVRRRAGGPGWQTGLSIVCCLAAAVGLWLTRSRGAILALCVAMGAALVLAGVRRYLSRPLAYGLAAVILTVALLTQAGVLDPALETGTEARQGLRDGWRSARAMFLAHPWLGVGPGNFEGVYPVYLQPGADELLTRPNNFALEMAATSGVFALAGVLAMIGSFFLIVVRRLRAGPAPEPTDGRAPAPGSAEADSPATEPTRWEFYLCAMAGLLLGYVLRYGGETPEEILTRTATVMEEAGRDPRVTIARSLVWFAAFALFVRVRWPGRVLAAALATGVAAALLFLCVSGGIGYPSVTLPLFLAMALALASLDIPPWKHDSESWLARALPLPLVIGFFLAFVFYPFDPVLSGMAHAADAAHAARALEKDQASTRPKILDRTQYVADRVVKPLREAVNSDPGNARWHLQLSEWSLWIYDALWRRPVQGSRGTPVVEAFGVEAFDHAKEAALLDPNGQEGYRALVRIRTEFARRERKPAERLRQLKLATDFVRDLALTDPQNPRLLYERAGLLREVGINEEALEAAQAALYWDSRLTRPRRKLGDWQRLELEQWIVSLPNGR